ncbi:MAG: V-type ATPase subunit, partial [Firmicutes bacterium]|nr:V-type ATPase subunit [Bacillota bacterium]
MSDTSYAYAVARIRSKEMSLITAQNITQLMASNSYQECLDLLAGKGWEIGAQSPEEMLALERNKTWQLIAELVEDMSIFNVFLIPNDYHNLKAAIKQISAEVVLPEIFIQQGTVPHEQIIQAVKENDFSLLPEQMRPVAKEAYEIMLHTNDGQLSDVLVDKVTLEAIYHAGKVSKNDLIKKYAELMVAAINIKIAVRCSKMSKELFFINRALACCDSINISQLGAAAAQGIDEICAYLERTDYGD